ncbi:MAG: hypothetical protein M3367_15660 [Acidobacteriota bacterium]|nr:hypothetical protein [Acidobacteriota bacterium]
MIEKIRACLCDESGNSIEIESSDLSLQSKLDVVIADTFSHIVRAQQDIQDAEIKTAEKFHFALNLKNYLEEMKENANTRRD